MSTVQLDSKYRNGILAQLVEHLTFNQVVRGSNPRCLTLEDWFEQKEFGYSLLCLSYIIIKTSIFFWQKLSNSHHNTI